MSQPQTRQYPAPEGAGRNAQGFGSRGTDSRLYQAYNERPNRYPGNEGGGAYPGNGTKSSRTKKNLITTLVVAAVAGTGLGLGGAYLFGGLFGSDDSAAAAPTHTVEQVASAIGCKPLDNQKNSQYRQAACTTSGGNRYTILTFDTDEHMKSWQDEAAGYGGAYLIGTRWLVVANNQNELTPYVSKLGGEVVVDKHG